MMTLLDVAFLSFPFLLKVVSRAGNQQIIFYFFEVFFANTGQLIALTRDARQATEGTLDLSLPLCIYTYESTKQICKSLI